jgi:hypothetical protein
MVNHERQAHLARCAYHFRAYERMLNASKYARDHVERNRLVKEGYEHLSRYFHSVEVAIGRA